MLANPTLYDLLTDAKQVPKAGLAGKRWRASRRLLNIWQSPAGRHSAQQPVTTCALFADIGGENVSSGFSNAGSTPSSAASHATDAPQGSASAFGSGTADQLLTSATDRHCFLVS